MREGVRVERYLVDRLGWLVAGLVGIVVTRLLAGRVGGALAVIRRSVVVTAPKGIEQAEFDAAIATPPEPGQLLGKLERILFFGALWLEGWLVIGLWLAFKVALMAIVWSQVIRVPTTFGGDDALSGLKMRHAWATRLLHSALSGTLANLFVGFVAALAARGAREMWELAGR